MCVFLSTRRKYTNTIIFSESTLQAHQFGVKSRSPPSYIAVIREQTRGESVIEREQEHGMFHCRKIAYFMFTHDPLPLYSQSIWSTRRIAVKTAAAVPNGRGCISGVSSGAGARRRMRQRTTCFARVGGSSAFYCTAALAHLLPTIASCACLYCSLCLRNSLDRLLKMTDWEAEIEKVVEETVPPRLFNDV